MTNSLMIFEGSELEILTKEDINFEFEGTVLFNGKQVQGILGYSTSSKTIIRLIRENQKYKVKNSDVLNQHFRKLNNAGETFITEKGVMKLIINSDMPKADEFEEKVWDIVTKVHQTGKYDSTEEQIKLIQDKKERELSLGLYSLQQALKVNPSDYSLSILVNQKDQELKLYKQEKQLEQIQNGIEELDSKIKKATVLREGDKSAKNIAKYFKVYSKNNKPHNQFADKIAKELGFYINPIGNAGYQDKYISINLTNIGGTTVSEIKYSREALELMKEYIRTYGLQVKAQYGKRGLNKGKIIKAEMIFKNGEHIFINENTYNIYSTRSTVSYDIKGI
ncbi:BRO-N domain-containing protein [Clostridium haemolyticum]|nr:Bro-N domain-containing protein [Clostridium haemolyticum]